MTEPVTKGEYKVRLRHAEAIVKRQGNKIEALVAERARLRAQVESLLPLVECDHDWRTVTLNGNQVQWCPDCSCQREMPEPS